MNRVRRLYQQYQPSLYRLHLYPNKQTMTFSGYVIIDGKKTGRPSKRLTLHAKDLKITKAQVYYKDRTGTKEIPITRIVNQRSYDELRLHSQDLMYPGNYTIEIEFSAKITRPMNGLYPCFYTQKGKEEIILATQFESHHAREVFPCIDEPEAKAVFELSLISPIGETVISNTDPSDQHETEQGVFNQFLPTPKMSTYLLAFAIGKLEYLETVNKSGVRVRTYSRPEIVQHTAFALDVAAKSLDLYNDYFGVDYPLNKCDLIALPDFASGAMENWGLITFREQALIVDKDNTSLGMRQYVVNVVAHELTHQWFGNLVTMRWWNDLWLNESFASLMSYVIQDKLFPKWQSWTQFIADEQVPALRLDQLEHTHPINVEIKHPDEIRTIFDNISYEKGASILFMLMKFLGEDSFRSGLNLYLTKHSYSNTQSSDLWHAWEEVSKKPVSDFMEAWTTQAGYPMIEANVDEYNVTIKQKRFYINPEANKLNTLWPIPLFSNIKLNQSVVSKEQQRLQIKSDQDSLIINHDRNAFYRVTYNLKHLTSLTKAVKMGRLSELDRLGLLADSFESAKAGLQPTTSALELLQAYADEDNVVVWEIIAANIGAIRAVMDSEVLRNAMNPGIQELVSEQYNKLGWKTKESDSHFELLLRPIILGLACSSEQPDAIETAKSLFKNRIAKPIHPDLRSIVYTSVARHGTKKEFDELLNLHNQSDNSEERLALTAALTNFQQPELIEKSLTIILTDEVRLQDVAYWISYSFFNRHAKDLTWTWLSENWNWLEKNIGNDLSFYMTPRYVARAYSDSKFLPEFEAFFRNRLGPGLNRPLDQAIETISWQSKWKDRDLDHLLKFYNVKES